MKRTLILLIALGILLATTGPAMAARKDKPPGNPTEFEVTMRFVGGQGLATTCDGDTITMTGNLGGGALRADGAELDMALPISWQRYYPESTGVALSGCHGGAATVVVPDGTTAPEVFPGALWIDFGPSGTISLKWRFDYYWEFEENPRNRKLTQVVIELFELNSTPMTFDGTGPQTVTGDFTLRRFTSGVWENDLGTTPVGFELTITPTP
jgi:hypothetical protein